MNTSFINFMKDFVRDMNKYEETRVLSLNTMIDKYCQHHETVSKTIISKIVKHNWILAST